MPRTRAAAVAVSLALVLTAAPSRAEVFTDVYAGGSFSRDADVTGRILDEAAAARADFGTSFTAGLRTGAWFPRPLPYVGIAVDVSWIGARAPEADVRLVPISFLAMGRVPLLADARNPEGKLEPYIGIGWAPFYAEVRTDLRPQLPRRQTESDFGEALDLRAGLAWRLKRKAVFGEYRFTRAHVRTEAVGLFPQTVTEAVDVTVKTHHLLVGVSFRFPLFSGY